MQPKIPKMKVKLPAHSFFNQRDFVSVQKMPKPPSFNFQKTSLYEVSSSLPTEDQRTDELREFRNHLEHNTKDSFFALKPNGQHPQLIVEAEEDFLKGYSFPTSPR